MELIKAVALILARGGQHAPHRRLAQQVCPTSLHLLLVVSRVHTQCWNLHPPPHRIGYRQQPSAQAKIFK